MATSARAEPVERGSGLGEPARDGERIVLAVHTDRHGTSSTVYLRGELDLGNANVADEALRNATESGVQVTVDLTGLRHLDSRGLRVILAAHERARKNDDSLRVVGTSGSVRRVMEISGTLGLLTAAN